MLGGGKFENGAVTGSFSRLFNDELHYDRNKQKLSWLDDEGHVLNKYDAKSGPFGKGALPAGYYEASGLYATNEKGLACSMNSCIDGLGDIGTLGYKIRLEALFSSAPYRDHLLIHPDQVGQGSPVGTLGCVGISCSDAARFYRDIKKYFDSGNKRISLTVDGALPFGRTK